MFNSIQDFWALLQLINQEAVKLFQGNVEKE